MTHSTRGEIQLWRMLNVTAAADPSLEGETLSGLASVVFPSESRSKNASQRASWGSLTTHKHAASTIPCQRTFMNISAAIFYHNFFYFWSTLTVRCLQSCTCTQHYYRCPSTHCLDPKQPWPGERPPFRRRETSHEVAPASFRRTSEGKAERGKGNGEA